MFVHLTHLVLSYSTLSNEIFCGSFLIKNLVIFVRATTSKRKHNVLIHYVRMFVHMTYLVLSYSTLPNAIFCGSFLIKNLVIFVRATTVKQILFHNHRNKEDVGGKHNVLIHYVRMFVHMTHLVFFYGTPPNAIFCGSFLIKNLVIFVSATTVKQILFHNHRNKKDVGGKHNVLIHYMRMFVHLTYLVLSYSTLSNEICCCVFTYIILNL
jgi:hypothetical protein